MSNNLTNKHPDWEKEAIYNVLASLPSPWEDMRKKKSVYIQSVIHEQSEFRNDVQNIDAVKSILGQKWKTTLQRNIYPFIRYLRGKCYREYIKESPIATTDKNLIDMLRSRRIVGRTRDLLEKLDCIKLINGDYSKKDKVAQIFILNRDTMDMILEFCVEKFGEIATSKNKQQLPATSVIEPSRCVFGKVSIMRKGINKEALLLNITQGLCSNYRQLGHYMDKREKLNKNIPDVFHGHLLPNIETTEKLVTRIGIRDWNDFCNKENIFFKVETLKIFGWKRLFQYDIKSSVPRVLLLLNTGKWMDQEIDIYELLNDSPFSDSTTRDNCKLFNLRCFFCSAKQVHSQVEAILRQRYKGAELSRKMKIVDSIKADVDRKLGEKNGTEVFLHESCIYMDVEAVLQKNGIQYAKKYDAFYLNGDDESKDTERKNMMDEIVKSCAENYYKDWILPQHQQ